MGRIVPFPLPSPTGAAVGWILECVNKAGIMFEQQKLEIGNKDHEEE